ncbi:16S rRNA (cytosine(1402)-N(4))-methyltransferase RsmH [Ignavibacteria bacterium 4148-Me]|uniref:16S rRNA (cytosine(1402)-N(4))-methyltransferase RsmH n=1 Tax=Rosettibacter primus TaxID=3111523 RepID=UPI00336BC2FE
MNLHTPVLLKESINLLITKNDGVYFEGTAGFGGHTEAILKNLNQRGKLIATDKDENAFKYCKEKFQSDKRFSIYNTTFSNIDIISKIEFIEKFDGIFVDLGVSSYQLDNSEAGFTFREDSPLDLRMNKNEGITAADVLNNLSEKEIADILFKFGEEKKSRLIAKRIVEARTKRKFETTFQLKEIIEKIVPPNYLLKSLSRVFQALRIYVNNELEELKLFLDKSINLLNKNGRIVVLTYHSLEDRIVKEKFKYETLKCVCPAGTPVCICGKEQRLKLVNSKPIVPSEDEIKKNKRARSAKLRAAERI